MSQQPTNDYMWIGYSLIDLSKTCLTVCNMEKCLVVHGKNCDIVDEVNGTSFWQFAKHKQLFVRPETIIVQDQF